MAVLNPDQGAAPPPNMPDQTRASRGQIEDRSLGIITEGVGSAVKSGVDLYNDYNHYQIDQQVRKGFNDDNKPYTDVLPNDLSKASETIGALQNAYDQGKLSDVYYTGQLAKLSKQLRSQYPQYEDYVDSTIQSVTGIRPANAFRNSLMQEFDKQAQASSDDEKFKRSYIKENEDTIAKLMPDYFTPGGADKYDFNFIRSAVSNDKAQTNYITKELLDINYLEKSKKLTADRAGEAADTALNYSVSASVNSLGNTLGVSGGDLIQRVQNAGQNGYTPEQFTQLMGQLGQYQFNMKSALQKQMYAPTDPNDPNSKSLAVILGPDETKKRIDAAMGPIDDIVKFATDQNWGMAAYYINLNKIKGDRDLNIILNASPEAAVENAFGKVNNDLAQAYLTEAGQGGKTNQETIFQQISPEIVARIAGGTDTLSGAAQRMTMSSKSDAEKASGVNALIDANAKTITSGLATPDQFANAVNGTYGLTKDGSSIFKLIRPEEYNDLYKTMYSSEVTDSIVKSGDKNLLKTYYDSAVSQLFATPAFTQAAKAISDTNDFTKAMTVQFVPGSNILVTSIDKQKLVGDLNAPETAIPGGIGLAIQGMRGQDYQRGIEAVKTLNSAFQTIDPMLDGLGVKDDQKAKVYEQIVKNLNINLESGKKGGLFDFLLSGFQNIQAEGAGQADPNKGLAENMSPVDTFTLLPSQNEPLSSDQSAFKAKVSSAESGGSSTAANPNSSALGQYQIIDSTWKGLMRLDSRLTSDGRTDPVQSGIAMDLLTKNYDSILKGDNLPTTDSNRYILHFLGPQDGPEILTAPADDPVSDYLSPRVIAANGSVLKGKTVGEVRAWAASKMS